MYLPYIYLVIPPPIYLILRLPFQEVVLIFYVEYFNELLRYFLGVHAVSHDVLSDNGLFRPMYSEGILHRTESVSLSVANGV